MPSKNDYNRGRRDERSDVLSYLSAANASKDLIDRIRTGKHIGRTRPKKRKDMPHHTATDCPVCERAGVRVEDPCPGPPAAIALIRHSDWSSRRLLVVSRKDGTYGLPGGKKEPYEMTMQEALQRELLEEIGIEALMAEEVYVAPSPRTQRTVYVFLVKEWMGKLQAIEADTKIEWMDPEQLISQTNHYGEFYMRMFEAVGW